MFVLVVGCSFVVSACSALSAMDCMSAFSDFFLPIRKSSLFSEWMYDGSMDGFRPVNPYPLRKMTSLDEAIRPDEALAYLLRKVGGCERQASFRRSPDRYFCGNRRY